MLRSPRQHLANLLSLDLWRPVEGHVARVECITAQDSTVHDIV